MPGRTGRGVGGRPGSGRGGWPLVAACLVAAVGLVGLGLTNGGAGVPAMWPTTSPGDH